MSDHDEQILMIKDCEEREEKLSDWERNFVQSLRERVDKNLSLTDRQIEKLNQIWDRIT